MINNRQGGRRRGRGGQRPQGMAGNSGNNARDSRQRGNAAQLLEKYKSMARDAQLAGDRVQTEYYLQFADHYFRVLEEGRSRFEDNQQQQQRRRGRDDEYDDDDGDTLIDADGDQTEDVGEEEEARPAPRRERPQERSDRPARRERANGRPQPSDRDERIDFAVLPPAIGADDAGPSPAPYGGEEDAPKRRVRRARAAEGDDSQIA